MTLDAAALAAPARSVQTAPSQLHTPWGVILCGTRNGDAIIASAEALAIVRAGRLVSALVIAGLETLKRTVVMAGGRTLALESGIYRIVR